MDYTSDYILTIHIITDRTRFRILTLLSEHPYCVKALAKKLGISESAVSQHLKLMKEFDIVSGTKIGYQMHYEINKENLSAVFEQFSNDVNFLFEGTNFGGKCECEYFAECTKNRKAAKKRYEK